MAAVRTAIKPGELAGMSASNEECIATIFGDGHVVLTTLNFDVLDDNGDLVGTACARLGVDIKSSDLTWSRKGG